MHRSGAEVEMVLEFVDTHDAAGIRLAHLDIGGGLGIRYRDEQRPAVRDYLARIFSLLGQRKVKLMFEPGRALVGNAGDPLAILSAGAHGTSVSSNYNTRPRPAEAIVDGAAAHLARAREPVESLFALERILP